VLTVGVYCDVTSCCWAGSYRRFGWRHNFRPLLFLNNKALRSYQTSAPATSTSPQHVPEHWRLKASKPFILFTICFLLRVKQNRRCVQLADRVWQLVFYWFVLFDKTETARRGTQNLGAMAETVSSNPSEPSGYCM